jgi:predicted RecB family nuclease
MADLFPDLAERLTALLYRIVDLLQIVRDHVAHPDFHGSYSMKAVGPALARGVSYDDLDIADGGEASAAFYRIVAGLTQSPETRDALRRSLLKYCQRDTTALARVHQWLIEEK